jgi:hypothetical protein
LLSDLIPERKYDAYMGSMGMLIPSAETIPSRAVVMLADLAGVPNAKFWFLDQEAETTQLAPVNRVHC